MGPFKYADAFDWSDAVSVSIMSDGSNGLLGLNSDGTVTGTINMFSDSTVGYTPFEEWTDIVMLSNTAQLSLKKDGTIFSIYETDEFDSWTDVVAVAGDKSCYAGLKQDGTVYWSGDDNDLEALDAWGSIIAVDVYYEKQRKMYVYGLTSDGTVLRSSPLSGTRLQGIGP